MDEIPVPPLRAWVPRQAVGSTRVENDTTTRPAYRTSQMEPFQTSSYSSINRTRILPDSRVSSNPTLERGLNTLPSNSETLERGAYPSGTLRSTINRMERHPSTLKRAKPILRGLDEAPPTFRRGATTNRLSMTLPEPKMISKKKLKPLRLNDSWILFAKIVTFPFTSCFLNLLGKRSSVAQQAWREKVALCAIIAMLCSAVGFLTFGLQQTLCPAVSSDASIPYFNMTSDGQISKSIYLQGKFTIRGYAYNSNNVSDLVHRKANVPLSASSPQDLTLLFTRPSACQKFNSANWTCESAITEATMALLPSDLVTSSMNCPNPNLLESIPRQRISVTWRDIKAYTSISSDSIYVFDGLVLNASTIPSLEAQLETFPDFIPGRDISLTSRYSSDSYNLASCLRERAVIAYLESPTVGCIASSTILTISTVVVLTLVFTKFFMALFFHWFMSARLVKPGNLSHSHLVHVEPAFDPSPYTVMLVTCYSEGEDSIRSTLDSLASTDYPDEKKLLFVVADGLVIGAGESRSTPDIVLELVELDTTLPYPIPASYLAIGEGRRQHNMAYVYSGTYKNESHYAAAVIVVKCGPREEERATKPGNRGKRDSQMILMNFLSRTLFDDQMTRLDFEIQFRIMHTLKVHPVALEYVLMVDADTQVDSGAMKYMINAMLNDRNIMGLCGETRIRNKTESWVTMIQVFEYYASHHLGKAFESVFGGVTCLPGCFSMYRIKISKSCDGRFIPLLVNPDILDEYSENIVPTLHKKNLLLLGEDRFLSTLMLRNFPKRKMMFVPQAVCHTVVPHEFKVLLSQRRRWINSTIHNLMELLMVQELCGIFCFSMQFVVLLELIGTVVLPAAISFTIYLLVTTALTGKVDLISMLLLLFILGLPAILIVCTSRKIEYVGWMCVYLLSLPIWNFVLPLYAFWHFDDFSWGETRRIDGETRRGGDKDGGHGEHDGGDFDLSIVPLKTWNEWCQVEDDQMYKEWSERNAKYLTAGIGPSYPQHRS